MARFPAGGSQIVWWIMENRREYFDRAKPVLNRVKMLIFLTESQTKQWQTWCEEENIKLRSQPEVVPLSVNDELAFVAGFNCSLNTPTNSPQDMLEKRKLLRDSVRKEMGLTDKDMLVMSLSSINAGKGQLLLVHSANLMIEQQLSRDNSSIKNSLNKAKKKLTLAKRHHLRGLLQTINTDGSTTSNEPVPKLDELKKKKIVSSRKISLAGTDAVSSHSSRRRKKVLSDIEGTQRLSLKVLIGSVGSKSNKAPYVKEILEFISQHSNLSKSMLWTPTTTRVASLYSAADVYIINSQVNCCFSFLNSLTVSVHCHKCMHFSKSPSACIHVCMVYPGSWID